MATEFIDLGMDFAGLNDGFDFGSVFSLFSLSSASSSLDKVESRVESLMPDLRRAASIRQQSMPVLTKSSLA